VSQVSARASRHMMRGTLSIFLAEVLILPTGLITAVFLARRLGPIDYGLFALVSRLALWAEWSGTAAFGQATVKFVGQTSDWEPIGATVVRLHLMVAGGIAALLWLLSSPLSLLFKEPVIANYLKLFAIDVPIFSLACANSNILVGRGYFKERAQISACRWIARLVLIVFFVELGLSVKGAIIGSIGASVVELLISWLYIRPPVFSKPAFSARRLWGFGAPLFMSRLSQQIFRLDLFALKVLGGTTAQVGFYGAALNLSIPPGIVSKSVSPPLLSTLSRLLGRADESQAKEIGTNALRSVIWLLPFAAMTAGAASGIVRFIFGQQYLPAAPILALLIFAALGLYTIQMAIAIVTALGRPAWAFRLSGPMVPLAVVGHLILIPWLGGVGAAIVTTSVACLAALASVFIVYRIWRVFPPVKTLLKGSLCSGLAFALAVFLSVSGYMIIFKLVAIMLVILLIFLLLGEFTPTEIAWIRSTIGRTAVADEDLDVI